MFDIDNAYQKAEELSAAFDEFTKAVNYRWDYTNDDFITDMDKLNQSEYRDFLWELDVVMTDLKQFLRES